MSLAEKNFGPNHPATIHAEVSLGFVCRDMHDFARRESISLLRRDKLRQAGDISRSYQAQIGLIEGIIWEGKYAEAEPMADAVINEAKVMSDQVLRDRYAADAMKLLIVIYDATNRGEKANEYRRELGINEPSTLPATLPTTQSS